MPTIEQIKALEIYEQAAIRKAKSDFAAFVLYTKLDYDMQWFHKVICNKLTEFEQGKIKKLMLLAPPQHGKSELSTRRFPAYLLGKNPNRKIVIGSYNSTLATNFNRDVQRIIDDELYHKIFPNTILNESNVSTDRRQNYLRNSEIFETVGYKGFVKTVGRGGALTGTPIDIGIIDDPIKDREEAMSLTIRESAWNWLTDVFETRFHNASQFLFMVTRWHEDDPAGRLLKRDGEVKNGGEWTVIKFPALKTNDPSDFDPRQLDEALWEERHSKLRIDLIRSNNPRTFNSLYQQDPKPDDSDVLWTDKWIEETDNIPELKKFAIALDPSGSGKDDSDECGIIAGGLGVDGKIYITIDETGIYTPLKWANKAVYLHESNNANCIVAEVNQGWDMVHTIIHQIEPKIKVEEVISKKGKYLRAEPIVSLYQQGLVKHKKGLGKLKYEMTTWTPDDSYSPGRIDALVHLINYLYKPKQSTIDLWA